MALKHHELRQAVIDGANSLISAGAISMNHHGNFSVRVPGTDTILLTATSSFDILKPENLALLDLDGKLSSVPANAIKRHDSICPRR
jgi:ribulose-5-phosphate 4-epimerase/fuculose-1-phosphate aldolase